MNDEQTERTGEAGGSAAVGQTPLDPAALLLSALEKDAPEGLSRPPLDSPYSEAIDTPPAPNPISPQEASDRIAALEREVRFRGDDPAAAPLLHEIGRLWEEQRSPRNAAIAYQNALRIHPTHLPTLQAARHLFAEAGNWTLVAQLLDTEANAADDPATQARLLFELGLVLDGQLGRGAEARSCFDRALELDPSNLEILSHLRSILSPADDPRALASLLIRSAEAIGDPRAAAHALIEAGQLLETLPDHGDRPLNLFRRAFAKSPGDPATRAQLLRTLERMGPSEELVRLLEAELTAGEEPSPAAAVSILYRMARVQLLLDQEDRAIDSLLAALRHAPQDPLIARELARIYELRESWEQLAEILASRAASTADENEKVAFLLELAELYDLRMDRPDRAIEQYRQTLRLAPANPVALAALGKLQHQRGDWEGLLQTFETEAMYAQDPKQKAARSFKAAVLLEERLGRLEDAIARYNEVLHFSPGYLPAQKALIRLYGQEGRYAELIAMLEHDLSALEDRDQIIATLSEIADIQANSLKDAAGALESYRRILRIATGHMPTIRAMARLAEANKRWEDLLEAHELEAAHTGDQRQVVSLLHRNAEILEELIEDKKRAIEAYQRVLSLAPNYLPALRSLGRLYAQKGLWRELVEMHRDEAELATSPSTAAALHFQIAELYQHKICDEEKAIASYRAALELVPSHFPSMRSLARIYRSQGAWAHLVELHRLEAAARADPRERAAALFLAAELWEDHLKDEVQARLVYEEVLQIDPHHLPALRGLERLYDRAGEGAELIRILERLGAQGEEAERVAALSRLTALHLNRSGDLDRAAASCEAALALAPKDPFLLRVMERIRGVQGDKRHRADLRERMAAQVDDPQLASALFLEAAADRIQSSPGADHQVNLEKAVDSNPRSERARELLERQLLHGGDPARLAVVLERRAAAATSDELRLTLLLRLGELRETRLGDPEGALATYREGLRLDPEHLPTLAAARRVLLRIGDTEGLRDLLLDQAGAEREPENIARSLVQAGQLSEALGQQDAAIEQYQRALWHLPQDAVATQRLEAILVLRGDAARIAAHYEERARSAADPAVAADSFVAAARLQMDALDAPAHAATLLDAALALAPEHPEALERRGLVAEHLGTPAEAIAAYGQRLRVGGDDAQIAPIHYRLAILHAAAKEASRALSHLQSALAANPAMGDALVLLARLHVEARNWEGAKDALQRLAEREEDPGIQARIQQDLARVHEEGFGDLVGAAACYERVIASQPEDQQTLERLSFLYERGRDLPRLVHTLDRLALLLSKQGQAPKAAQLMGRAAAIHAGPLRDPIVAVQAYQQALAWNPGDRELRLALADLYAADPKFHEQAIQQYRLALQVDARRPHTYRALFRIWSHRSDRDRAFVAASILHFLRAADQAESVYFAQHHGLRPAIPSAILTFADLERTLIQPSDSSPLAEIARVLEEPIGRRVTSELSAWEIQREDRLRPEHPLRKHFDKLCESLSMDPTGILLYTTPRPVDAEVILANQPTVVVGRDFTTRLQKREQTFVLGRLLWQIRQGSAFFARMEEPELTRLLGNAIRIHRADHKGLGTRDDEGIKRLSKSLGRKGRKALEAPVQAFLEGSEALSVGSFLHLARRAADRAGLVLCGDLPAALNFLLRDEQQRRRLDSQEAVADAIEGRDDVAELLEYAVSEEHFELRRTLRLGLP